MAVCVASEALDSAPAAFACWCESSGQPSSVHRSSFSPPLWAPSRYQAPACGGSTEWRQLRRCSLPPPSSPRPYHGSESTGAAWVRCAARRWSAPTSVAFCASALFGARPGLGLLSRLKDLRGDCCGLNDGTALA